MNELQMNLAWLRAWTITRRAEARNEEGGFTVAEWVVMASIVIAGAIAIVTLVINKFKDKATGIPTG